MGAAYEVIAGRVTNPGATITALTVDTGDSFTVKSFPDAATAAIVQAWVQQGTVGVFRITSPRLHDAVSGIRLRNPSTAARPLLPYGVKQPVKAQDALTVALSGSAAATDHGAYVVYYDDLDGADQKLATWEEIAPRIVNAYGSDQNVTTGATAGDWASLQAVNADQDQFKRATDYALLGYETDTAVGTLAIAGPDTSNLRVGGPGTTEAIVTSGWFVDMARALGKPFIPIISGANIGATNIWAVHTTASVAINVTLILAELSR